MKKSLSVIAAVLILLCCGCKKAAEEPPAMPDQNRTINGVWISYIEFDKMVAAADFEKEFGAVAQNCKNLGITDIFLHTVVSCDAIYNSAVYKRRYESDKDYLSAALKICHKNDIYLHAWMNPYRVKTGSNDINALSGDSIAYKWLNDEDKDNDDNVLICKNGIYLNPAKAQVRRAVIDAVREICRNYQIDGIHFDDYFYPETSEEFDKKCYEEYIASTNLSLSLADFRRANVNSLISGCYTAVKFINKDILFTVSPAADVDKNYNNYFADIVSWCQNGCVDIIIPQLYFGYEYSDERFRFDNLMVNWKDIAKSTNTDICIGLAAYKIGLTDELNGEEWSMRDDILARQTKECMEDKDIRGQVYYSYSSLFSEEELNTKSRNNLKKVIKQ